MDQTIQTVVKCPKCQTGNWQSSNYCLNCGAILKQSIIDQNVCPFCQAQLTDKSLYCSSCGRRVREKILPASLVFQLGIYLLSFFLPPLGLWPGFKYLKQINSKLRIIGVIAILLTFISIVISVILLFHLMNYVNQQVNSQLQNMTF